MIWNVHKAASRYVLFRPPLFLRRTNVVVLSVATKAKAEEPERTLFVSGAERIGLPCHGRHVLSSRLPPGFNIFSKRLFRAVSETAEKDTLKLLASI